MGCQPCAACTVFGLVVNSKVVAVVAVPMMVHLALRRASFVLICLSESSTAWPLHSRDHWCWGGWILCEGLHYKDTRLCPGMQCVV